VAVIGTCAISLLTWGIALAHECDWCEEVASSLIVSKSAYPTSNFDPYQERVNVLRDAFGRGDQNTLKETVDQLFTMLRIRANGIDGMAADELYSYWHLILPIENLMVPMPFHIETVPPDAKDYNGVEFPNNAEMGG